MSATRWVAGSGGCWASRKEGLNWIRVVHVLEAGGEDLRWFTRTTQPVGWAEQEAEQRRLAAKGKGKGKNKGKHTPVLIQPLWRPDAIDMDNDPDLTTERRKRAKRAQMAGYAFRVFATEGQQVARVGKNSSEPVAKLPVPSKNMLYPKPNSMNSPEPVAG